MSFAALVSVALAAKAVTAFPFASRVSSLVSRATTPKVATATPAGIATDVYLNRDSCNSVLVDGRELWTCRDTQTSSGAFLSSTASWSNFASDGTPDIIFDTLSLYGDNPAEYFGVQSDECGGTSGQCSDGTRWAIWPDSRPLPVKQSDGTYSLYTWIRNYHISGLTVLNANQPTSLYRATYDPSQGQNSNLPADRIVNEEFWADGAIPYGNYGWVVVDGIAYLYGSLDNKAGQALARVPIDSIEDQSAYNYYTGSGWSNTAPPNNDSSVIVANAGTGQQGTFYYSTYFNSYLWIGSPYIGDNAIFMLSTAPAPEGPWTEPVQIYEGTPGNATGLTAYSQQAHPGLSKDNGNGNDIWLSYTKVDNTPAYSATYTTELIHLTWQ